MAEKKEYVASEEVKKAQAAAEAQQQTKPDSYQSAWTAQLQQVMDKIQNRQPFQYNLNGDALYRQYRDQAVRDGRLAMTDAMGQAAALTGGYGNSYAQMAGQQAYQRQLDSLGDRIPELYALALDQYRQQTQGLQQQYDLLAGADSRDYSRYQDALAAWQQQADSLWQAYVDARDFDYSIYKDQLADWQWQQEFDEDKRRYDQEWEEAHAQPKVVYVSQKPAKQEEEEKKTGIGAVLGALSGVGSFLSGRL